MENFKSNIKADDKRKKSENSQSPWLEVSLLGGESSLRGEWSAKGTSFSNIFVYCANEANIYSSLHVYTVFQKKNIHSYYWL